MRHTTRAFKPILWGQVLRARHTMRGQFVNWVFMSLLRGVGEARGHTVRADNFLAGHLPLPSPASFTRMRE